MQRGQASAQQRRPADTVGRKLRVLANRPGPGLRDLKTLAPDAHEWQPNATSTPARGDVIHEDGIDERSIQRQTARLDGTRVAPHRQCPATAGVVIQAASASLAAGYARQKHE